MNALPPILARDMRRHRAEIITCFVAFGGLGASFALIGLVLIGVIR